MERLSLHKLILEVEQRLHEMHYSPGAIKSYRKYWRELEAYASEIHADNFTVELGEQFLLEKYGIDVTVDNPSPNVPMWVTKLVKRCVYTLAEYQSSGVVVRKCKSTHIQVKENFQEAEARFYRECRNRYNSEATIKSKAFTVKRFLLHLEQTGLNNFAEIADRDITAFLRTTVAWSQRTVATTVCNLRQFLSFLYREKYVATDFAVGIITATNNRNGRLPNIWTPDAVKRILSVIDRGNPIGKRDYAILMLVTHLGLRDSDVQNLKFENLHWREQCIRLTQTKTGRSLELPLTAEIGEAIIDYLKYGRPKQDTTDYVFIRHMAPYGKCKNYYHVMRSHLRRAGIPFDSTKPHGLHTLRHTLATRLLELEIPLQTISEILGHANSNSTKVYLQVDLNALRQCALNPEEVYDHVTV